MKRVFQSIHRNPSTWTAIATFCLVLGVAFAAFISYGKTAQKVEDVGDDVESIKKTIQHTDGNINKVLVEVGVLQKTISPIAEMKATIDKNSGSLEQINRTLDLVINPPSADEIKSLRARVSALETQLSEARGESSSLKRMISDVAIKTDALLATLEALKNEESFQTLPQKHQTEVDAVVTDLKNKVDALQEAAQTK